MKTVADKFIKVLNKNVNDTIIGAHGVKRQYVIEGTNKRVSFDGYYSKEGGMVNILIEEKCGDRYFHVSKGQVKGNLNDIYYGIIDFLEPKKSEQEDVAVVADFIENELEHDVMLNETIKVMQEEHGKDFDLEYEVGNFIYYTLTDEDGEPRYSDEVVAEAVSQFAWAINGEDEVCWIKK